MRVMTTTGPDWLPEQPKQPRQTGQLVGTLVSCGALFLVIGIITIVNSRSHLVVSGFVTNGDGDVSSEVREGSGSGMFWGWLLALGGGGMLFVGLAAIGALLGLEWWHERQRQEQIVDG